MSILFPATLSAAWRALTWKHWAWTTAVAVLVSMSMPLQDFFTNRYWAFWRVVYHTPWYLFTGYAFLVAIAVTDASARYAVRISAWRYVVAMLFATVVVCATAGTFPSLVRTAPHEVVAGEVLSKIDFAQSEVVRKSPGAFAVASLNPAIIQAWLATFIFLRLRGARRAMRALADAEVERVEAQGRLIGARLVAAQAQIDPGFVLQQLEEVERAYETDPARADDLLDEFIAFLRDAIPRIRAEESTEVEDEPQGSPG